jgi:hypothetical protein
VSDGSWHYVALTYGDTTATVDSAEAAAVTLPAKLLGDLMLVSLHAGHFHSALDELRVWDSAYTAARWRRWRAPRRYRRTDSLLPVSDSVTATAWRRTWWAHPHGGR